MITSILQATSCYKTLIALILFLVPPDLVPIQLLNYVSHELIELSVKYEVLEEPVTMYFRKDVEVTKWVEDPKTHMYEVKKGLEVTEDLREVQNRLLSLVDCPPVWINLPPTDYLKQGLDFNEKYREYLVDEFRFYPESHYKHKILSDAITKTEKLGCIYQYAYWASYTKNRLDKRHWLKRLMQEVGGKENLLRLPFPPCVPLEYFSSRD